jgi:hypothetical protein
VGFWTVTTARGRWRERADSLRPSDWLEPVTTMKGTKTSSPLSTMTVCSAFSRETCAGICGNGEDAPKVVPPLPCGRVPSFDPQSCCPQATRMVRQEEQRIVGLSLAAALLGNPQSFVSAYESGQWRVDLLEFLVIVETAKADPLAVLAQVIRWKAPSAT